VLFNNKTTDKVKKAEQVQKLLSLVESVVKQNNGKPYSDELFHELQVEIVAFTHFSELFCFGGEDSNCGCNFRKRLSS